MKTILIFSFLYSGISIANTQDQNGELKNENSKNEQCDLERRISAERYEGFYEGRREGPSE